MSVYLSESSMLESELRRLDLCLTLAVLEKKGLCPAPGNDPFGVAVTSAEMSEFLGIDTSRDHLELIEEALTELERLNASHMHPYAPTPVDPEMELLLRALGIDQFQWRILLACIAPVFHHKYRRLYGYLADNMAMLWPDVALLIRILARTHEQRLRVSGFIHSQHVARYRLVHSGADGQLRPNPRLLSSITGDKSPSASLNGAMRHLPTSQATPDPRLPDAVERAVLEITENMRYQSPDAPPVRIHLKGSPGAGRRDAAGRMSAALGFDLYEVDLSWSEGGSQIQSLNQLVFELLLSKALPLIDVSEKTEDPHKQKQFGEAVDLLHSRFPIVFMLNGAKQEVVIDPGAVPHLRIIPIHFPEPTFSERAETWRHALASTGMKPERLDHQKLAAMYRFTRGRIFEAVRAAHALKLRNADVSHDALLIEAARGVGNRKLAELAERVLTIFKWDQLVLPEDSKQHLHDLVHYFTNRDRIFDDWGFGKRVSQKGLHALFYGPPGTGKTMAAGIIASQLDLEIYRIDLSQIISKYIGETEKNLAEVFREARDANAILFFDEADALFGKRSEVNDARDRFANVEVSYLLQEMESYEGVTILATNLLNNLDEAFTRRIKAIIEFPFPEAPERLLLWKSIFPDRTPIDEEVDLDFLANRFKLTGGEIKNVALAAASFAMAQTEPINMKHLLWSIREEQEKQGRIFVPADYGTYADLAREHPLRNRDE